MGDQRGDVQGPGYRRAGCAAVLGHRGLYSSYAACVKGNASLLAGASDTGKAIGVGLIVIVWVVVDFLVGLTYGIYRLARR